MTTSFLARLADAERANDSLLCVGLAMPLLLLLSAMHYVRAASRGNATPE